MAKAVKLKNNLYLDTRAIVHNKKILNTILFPIGYVYLSVNNTNPGTIFGGTWEQISGYYLYAGTGGTKTSYTGTGTRGHRLTKNQSGLPRHGHGLQKNVPYGMPYNDTGGTNSNNGGYTHYGESYNPFTILDNDGFDASEEHSHNIATYQIYAWKRVS